MQQRFLENGVSGSQLTFNVLDSLFVLSKALKISLKISSENVLTNTDKC